MIAIDTNLLIYAHRAGTREHSRALAALDRAASSSDGWGVSHSCIAEFWTVVTHPAATGRPSSPEEASAFLLLLFGDGGAHCWLPQVGFHLRLLSAARKFDIRGARIFDLQVALNARENGAHEIWTHDRGFVSIPGLEIVDPLTD